MGQKVNPNIIRIGIIKESNSRWFPVLNKFNELLKSDIKIREIIRKKFFSTCSISNIFIERTGKNIKIIIRSSKPGFIIGKKGEEIDKLRSMFIKKLKSIVHINIKEVKTPDSDAVIVADNIARQLEKRMMFRRVMKKSISSALKQGAKGIKISISGRLGGNDIARKEWYKEGRVPLQTFRANIDYHSSIAKTNYGIIGIKVWIFKGEILNKKNNI